jgi:Fe-S-cluster-containing hydrogenase component 2
VENLTLTWEEVEANLQQISGVEPRRYKRYFDQGLFFKIRYRPGEIIMPKGAYSDYAGLHIKGKLLVLLDDRPRLPVRMAVRDAWSRPGRIWRWIEDFVLDRTDRLEASDAKKSKKKAPDTENTPTKPRFATPLAQWIRRRRWFVRHLEHGRLAEQRLASPTPEASIFDQSCEELIQSAKQVIEATVQQEDDGTTTPRARERFKGVTGAMWNQPRNATLVAALEESAGPCEMLLIKRLALQQIDKESTEFHENWKIKFVEHILPGLLKNSKLLAGMAADFEQLATLAGIELKHYDKGDVVIEQGDEAKSLSLIVNGIVQVSRMLPGAAALAAHLKDNDYFGHACVFDDVPRTARITAVTDVHIFTIPREVLRDGFFQLVPELEEKLKAEAKALMGENIEADALKLLPPLEPPEPLVPKLMQARNILLIDMDVCTRCDQCVRACAATHEGIPRFHRGNPDLRFGKWEIAAACVHCINAPCQRACPVGAITFLDNGNVQIHRSRCISCEQCVDPCPFNVIEMLERRSPEEAPVANANKDFAVATKCDLCLTDDRRETACVAACPYGAAERGPPDELFLGIEKWLQTNQPV